MRKLSTDSVNRVDFIERSFNFDDEKKESELFSPLQNLFVCAPLLNVLHWGQANYHTPVKHKCAVITE